MGQGYEANLYSKLRLCNFKTFNELLWKSKAKRVFFYYWLIIPLSITVPSVASTSQSCGFAI